MSYLLEQLQGQLFGPINGSGRRPKHIVRVVTALDVAKARCRLSIKLLNPRLISKEIYIAAGKSVWGEISRETCSPVAVFGVKFFRAVVPRGDDLQEQMRLSQGKCSRSRRYAGGFAVEIMNNNT